MRKGEVICSVVVTMCVDVHIKITRSRGLGMYKYVKIVIQMLKVLPPFASRLLSRALNATNSVFLLAMPIDHT